MVNDSNYGGNYETGVLLNETQVFTHTIHLNQGETNIKTLERCESTYKSQLHRPLREIRE